MNVKISSGKREKVLKFFKKNMYLIIIGFSIGILALILSLTLAPTQVDAPPPLVINNDIPTADIPNAEIPVVVPDDTNIVIEDVPSVPAATIISMSMPVLNATISKDFSSTALQYNKTLNQWESHKAIDFLAEVGTNVSAVLNGVIESIETTYANGTTIVISHENNIKSIYKSVAVSDGIKIGDQINQGDIIGKIDMSMSRESSDGAHLHFEIEKDGAKVDPNEYLNITNK